MTSRHGSESFFVIGEGLINTQLGGRSGTDPDPITHPEAAASVASDLAADAAPPFRFSRVGPKGPKLKPVIARKLANAMAVFDEEPDGTMPAGYTYLGQFIDHDLTKDATDVSLGDNESPATMLQARSPSLDLDSLYGAGPGDPVSAEFYDSDGVHLKTGDSMAFDGVPVKKQHDLPRSGKGNAAAKRTALIGDPRNDENLIVAQTHLAMIHFHNQVVDKQPAALTAAQKFRRARKSVTLHYQWLIRHDFLPRIVQPSVVDDVFANGRKLVEPAAGPTDVPTMPIEFSVAAYRLGHSLVRPSYDWNRKFPNGDGFLGYMFEFSAGGGNLGGFAKLASNWIADWRRMFNFPDAGHPELAGPFGINRAKRIDTLIADPLKFLPASTFGETDADINNPIVLNLAFRNLTRGSMVKLATGQQMVEKLNSVGVNVQPLTRNQILSGSKGAKLTSLSEEEQDVVATQTPLWFYILREAETGNSGKLRGVGARIVAETFHRAMQGSRFSLLSASGADFHPTFGRGDTFEMTDLLFFAFKGKKTGINPLGD